MLKLENVQAGYGAGQVLFGVDLEITPGSCVSLLGRNGMGKTTTIRTIMGQLALQAGRISRFGDSNVPRNVHEIARAGIGLVPEGRQIFPNLSVAENLRTFHRPPVIGGGLSGPMIVCLTCFRVCVTVLTMREAIFPAASSRCSLLAER